MIKHIYHKLKSNQNDVKFAVVFVISLLSLGLGLYNFFQLSRGSKNIVVNPGDQKSVLPIKDLIRNIDPSSPKIGNVDSKVIVVEFEDFQCPFCKRFHDQTYTKIKSEYLDTNKILFIHQDVAFLGLESTYSAEAAHCAAEQGKYWEYRDSLYENQKGENSGALSDDNLKRIAKTLGLNLEKFNSCYSSGKYKDVVEKSTAFAATYGINGTPTFVINDQIVKGALSTEVFEKTINELLAK